MQYILTQEEFDKHKADAARIIGKMADDLQTACTLVADHKPITVPWDRETKDVWGCIITHSDHHCDHCPVQKICPYPHKSWSK